MGEAMNSITTKENKMRFDNNNEDDEDPNAVTNFRISKALREALTGKGIESLFPIQAMTFNTILDGSDLVGRARTGQVRGSDFNFYIPQFTFRIKVLNVYVCA